MMLRRLVHICVSVVMLAGCADDSFRGTSDGLYGDDGQSIPVVVALGDPGGGIAKGAGAIDSIEEWSGGNMYVYAFCKSVQTSYAVTSRKDPLNCLVDASKDVYGSLAGKKARLDARNAYAEWETEDQDLVYPGGGHSRRAFDFFAYYVDDAAVSGVKRTDDAVVVDLEIDGSQDVMSSKAEITERQLAPYPQRDQALIVENRYSFYTAQRNMIPTFVFDHHLVRLEFEIHAGLVTDEHKSVLIHGFEIRSKSKAHFTVAAKDEQKMGLVFDEEKKYMDLTEEGGKAFYDGKYTVSLRSSSDVAGEVFKMGDCLLVAPDGEYDAYMTMTEKRSDGSVVISRARTPLTVSYPAGQFKAGNQYKVKLTVYGATRVSASVEMEPWHYGGQIDMDTENDKPII
jgi:hypothetical protein